MDSQKSPAKLTRTASSILRSSPTIRSSIQSLSSVSEIDCDQDFDEQKLHRRKLGPLPLRSFPATVAAFLVLLLYTLFTFSSRNNISASENCLFALTFIAVTLFFISRNLDVVRRKLNLCKQFYVKKLGVLSFAPKTHSSQVQWFIGESGVDKIESVHQTTKEIRVNKIVKEGVEFYSNGDFYEGEFHKGRCNGSGVYNYFANGRYEGDWVDGKYDGHGIESWARGSRYRGQYRQGLRHGYGVYKFYTGDTYSGEWCNGQSHGIGVQTCVDGSCYTGEFKLGVKHGLGFYHFRNGDRYAGEYFGDRIHGFGVYHFSNGHRYEGSWHEGRRQGCGMYTFRSGDVKCGEWDSGSLKTNLAPLTDAVVGAVQAARRRAERAVQLHEVKEQVNKAALGANRAATAARVAAVKAVQNRIDGAYCNTNCSIY